MRRDRADVADAVPPFQVGNAKRIDSGSLVAVFELRINGVYLPNTKYFRKDDRAWVRCSHKSDRGEWVTDALFDDDISDAIAESVALALDSLPPSSARESSSRPYAQGQRSSVPRRAASDANAQRREDLYARGEAGLGRALDDEAL